MRWLTLGALALAAACGATDPEPAAPKPEPLAPEGVTAAVRGAVEQYRQAYEVASFEAIEPLYVKGRELAVTSKGRRYRGWEEVRIYLEELLGGARMIRLEVTNVEVVALGSDAAYATVSLNREMSDGAATVAERGTLSLVFQLREVAGIERWRIVSEHFSSVPAGF
jgi:hypothetical protein